MRLGLMVGYWGLGMGPADQLAVVQEGRAAGFHSAWAAEAYGSDAATVLAWLAAGTSTIRLGAGIFQMPGRSPAMTAMTAATIDELSGGRMLLGIGSSGPQVSEGWHGQRFAQQLQRTREYVAVVRPRSPVERLVFAGETIQLPLPDGPGRALKLTIGAVQDEIPIHRPRSGRATRRWRARSPTAGCRPSSRPRMSASSASCCGPVPTAPGRTLDGFDIAPTVQVYISDDRAAAPGSDAADPGPVHRRHGIAQGRTSTRAWSSATGSRIAARDGPGPVPRRQTGRGRRGTARRADRHGLAVWPP